MLWIESHVDIADHPKTRRLMRALDVDLPTAVGLLHLFWHWAIQYATSGDLKGFNAEEIANGARWEGDAEAFVEALVVARFLDRTKTKRLRIHDWTEYSGRLIELKAKRSAAGRKGAASRWGDGKANGKTSVANGGANGDANANANGGANANAIAKNGTDLPTDLTDRPTNHTDRHAELDRIRDVLGARFEPDVVESALKTLSDDREGGKQIDSPLAYARAIAKAEAKRKADRTPASPCPRCGREAVLVITDEGNHVCDACYELVD